MKKDNPSIDRNAVHACISRFYKAFMSFPLKIPEEEYLDVYLHSLQGLPSWALQKVTDNLVFGMYSSNREILKGVVPLPSVLASLVRKEAEVFIGVLEVLKSRLGRLFEERSNILATRLDLVREEETREEREKERQEVGNLLRDYVRKRIGKQHEMAL
ncbi:hypothetical protein B488_04900 [Liberibacter crescens BT-1]|uniref:Uncharacterized protein n=1 Tax=Liberibacter crescens (strain BT-1) TaxID=1215343 RepID=L0EU50_LIBCB|nr:hypothetical protein [Liberibacter crescens]AGA64482.1 hypothetical protein B488_04900 [Liberibacter crescens BT-1]AMC12649.1 hypothetical protein RL73_02565 [Liberibacter crescens]